MTDADSEQPAASEQEPSGASPDQPKQQETDKSKSGRSNEFRLALAGIAATVIIGVTGAFLSYMSSVNQMKSQSSQATLQFIRNQRQAAYTQYLLADIELANKEFRLVASLSPKNPGDRDKIQQFKGDFFAANAKYNQANAPVLLAASEGVTKTAIAVGSHHDNLSYKIAALLDDSDHGKFSGAADDLLREIDNDGVLRQQFIDAAKSELGLK
jgi:hypothetical protein